MHDISRAGTMELFSVIRHSLQLADSNNPVLKHYHLGRQIGTAGPEMVWKIYEAQRLSDKKVRYMLISCPMHQCAQ